METLLRICAFFFLFLQLVYCQNCQTSQGKDIQGNDYYNVKGQPGDCCRLCHESYYCRAYSWTNYEGGTCWLKYAASPIVDGADVVLGILNGNSCQTQKDSDIEGQDLSNVGGQPENSCCDICFKTKGCNAYSWNDFNGGTCWLKSATGPIVKKDGVTVGVLCVGGDCSADSKNTGCGSGWKTLKKYEFNNMDKVNQEWNTMEWGPKRVNAELQAYVKLPANIFIKNNNLVLRAVKSGDRITSGRLQSKEQFSPKNVPGNKLRVEFTAKVPAAMGSWPALWMLGSNGQYGPQWPLNGEIDVMEWVWQMKNMIKSALHWKSGSDWGQDFSDGVNIRKVSTSFHTYGVEYSSQGGNEYIQFYLRKPDGQTLYGSKATPDIWHGSFNGNCKPNCPAMAPFDSNMILILNIAVGGDWGGCCGVQNYDVFENGVEMEISSVDVCASN